MELNRGDAYNIGAYFKFAKADGTVRTDISIDDFEIKAVRDEGDRFTPLAGSLANKSAAGDSYLFDDHIFADPQQQKVTVFMPGSDDPGHFSQRTMTLALRLYRKAKPDEIYTVLLEPVVRT